MAKKMVGIDADLGEALSATGFIQGIAETIQTDKHLNAAMNVIFADLASEFVAYMDAYAAAAPEKFHHVYEWDLVGVPKGRLYKPVMHGRGRNRTISWDWRASRKTVPVSPEAQDVGVKQIHVFVWKAPFMEYNTNGVYIEAKRHDFVSAFTRDDQHGLTMIKGGVHVENPGGPAVRGAFTLAFSEWWGQGLAHEAYIRRRTEIERTLKAMPIALTARRSKGFTLSVAGAGKAIADGQAAGRQYVQGMVTGYIEQARARAAFIDGGYDE